MSRALRLAASLKLTLLLLAAVAAVLLWGRLAERDVGVWLAIPFAGMVLNLLAAIAVHEKLRRQPGLLVFHLGLAVLALVAAAGRLMALDGRVEVTVGAGFDPAQLQAKAAPLHPWGIGRAEFEQGPFTVDYDAGMRRRATRSTVYLPTSGGGRRAVEVGDDRPLVIGAYRLYTTPNKGFAPLLTWTGADGGVQTGAVHLPPYPMEFERQGNEWTLPDGSRQVVVWLEMPAQVFVEDAPWSFRIPKDARLAVIDGDRRVTLAPGESVELGTGRLRFERLTAWMGYTVFYDPSLPWLAAAALVALAGLAWHAVSRLRNLTDGSAWRREAGHAA